MPYTILIVDDDREFRQSFIRNFSDYEIVEAQTGEEALGIIKKPNNIDFTLLDMVMPGLSGIETMKEIKKLNPELYVVAMTAYGTKDLVVELLKARADDFMDKPIDSKKLNNIIERYEKNMGKSGRAIYGRVDRIKRYIDINYNKSIGLKDAAELVHLSPKYLSRMFKRRLGLDFKDYKRMARLKKADELLKNTEYSISQISEKIGYKNVVSFIRIFEKFKGKRPTEYRLSFRKR